MKAKNHKSASKVIAELCGDPSIEKEVKSRLRAKRSKPKKTRIIIEHGDERYEVKFNRDCMRTCSFVKHTPYGPCENCCSLPRWFEKIVQKFPESHLKRIDKE
jgi:hypothetical protein